MLYFKREFWSLLMLSIGLFAANTLCADDWPQWGGPQQDFTWHESGIVAGFPPDKLPPVWTTPIGEGYAGPSVADNKVFVTDRIHGEGRHGTERVLALDVKTGEVLWKHEYPCLYDISYPAGPRATPVYDNGKLYTIGAVGNMFCFDANSGEVLWSKDFQTDYGTQLPTWGMAAAPVVDGDQLITLVGGEDSLVVSFDKTSGKELWRSLNDPIIGYCPPAIFNFGQSRQLIIYHPLAVSSINPQNGKLNWEVPCDIKAGLSIATPRKHGNRLFVTSFYNGSIMLEVDPAGSGAKILWEGASDSEVKTDGLHGLMCTPHFDGEYIYGVCSYGQLRCLNAQTGERIWETRQATGDGRWWNAFLVQHEDRFFIHNEQGELIIAKLSPEGYTETARAQLIEPTRKVQRRQTIWSHPAFAGGSIFARNDKEILRVHLRKK